MTYTIKYTDNINNSIPVVVNDSTINTQTNLKFPGRNARGYGEVIGENFLHLLENFARDTSPGSNTGEGTPVTGQLWYDSTQSVKKIKVYDGQNWKPIGTIVSNDQPAGDVKGDLWVDTLRQQLYLWNGSSWLLVGPNNGIDSGSIPVIIKDISGKDQVIVKTFVYNQFTKKSEIVSITSLGYTDIDGNKKNEQFTPSPPIDGFLDIYPGVNLRKITNNKFWGTSEKAENLIDANSDVVPTSRFLRTDRSNSVDLDFNIKNNTGLSIGVDSTGQLKFQILGSIATISHGTLPIDIKIRKPSSSNTETIIRFDPSTFNVGINTLNPTRQLDVLGTGRFSDKLEITKDTDIDSSASINSSSVDLSALSVAGGVVVKKKIRVGDDAIVDGQIYLNYSPTNGGSVILPAQTNLVDIGSSDVTFRNIYANKIYGTVTGSIVGDISGNAATANSLKNYFTLNMIGDITSTDVVFKGNESTKTFTTALSPDYYTRQIEVADTSDSDLLLIYRFNNDGSGGLLRKTAKSNFVKSLATVPIGTIITFAGTVAPIGYLFCDGSEKQISVYQSLYNVISDQYGQATGYNTFKLPDLRGRFPLGRLDMDNSETDTVVNNDRTGTIPAGGGLPTGTDLENRVGTTSAQQIGAVGGNESQAITQANLPMDSVDSATGTGVNRESYNGDKLINKLPIVNPFLTINYLIYAGK